MNIRRKLIVTVSILSLIGVFLSHTFFAAAIESVTKGITSDAKKVTASIYNNTGQTVKVPVTSVSIDKPALALKVGDTWKLKSAVYPLNASVKGVYWITDNRKVIRVSDDGTVRAVGPGITYVSVITENGNKLAQCLVEVQKSSVVKIPVTGIIIDKKAITMKINDIARLKAYVTPVGATYKSFKWISGNSAVATVDNDGTLKAVGYGAANITAVTTDSNKTALCTVKVMGPSVTGVTLNKTSLILKINGNEQLTALVKPDNADDKSVIWTSNNKTIADVDANGKVTAIKAGKAVITVKTISGGFLAECSVTVTPPPTPIPVLTVTLNKTSLTLKVNKSETLIAAIKPINAADKTVTWFSSNKTIATVDTAGKVKALKTGKVTITVKTKNGSKTASCTVNVVR